MNYEKNYTLRHDLALLASLVGPEELLPKQEVEMPLGLYVGVVCATRELPEVVLALIAVRLARELES